MATGLAPGAVREGRGRGLHGADRLGYRQRMGGRAAGWLRILERDGGLVLVAEGAYVRYGVPLHVTVRREGRGSYRFVCMEEGDGMSQPPTTSRAVDRAELERLLDGLAAGDRPVERLGIH